ncbi:TPA: N-acetyllactosaminide alpha-2,3-sialyltransferase [Neisseria gonorrhoeae]|uniref:N-acetyllactosaminide alpha-2,3-sialyltransferase n=1 Tax=Neisseria gonorrhoeae TaxID=485 RepID=UPI0008DC2169|nr:N-acetyllactosaminide alpha-2,3-sialyltransferase [Neisseria gonorrhoeae]OHZ74998.1 CMP-N-acetylneuraminate-beta-galactosamide-alpha-2, 3-sialyltransferase [Neisseria gonorrhoeae]OHZ79266.1 CMP-N-acetylneuraminate-beta-galactosamide-alpha-2, 3-sialyltransferase [Neisseria gonorrhoeae]OHZ81313.1 CMP-N-acetylneuraminate-beta-galactosamide-alpha-2, 3-sialyltransferase [Neisseria gonorrhoeae]OIA01529.1 CMP-N-acetylneuraminate-beta-galactosamide-alpha-2, 3-sialyltransferase [Neisseria gonorrhoeae
MGLKKACLTVLCLIVFCVGIFYTFDRVNQGERNAVSLLKDKLFNEEGEPVNLIFCYTILQMKVAERIMAQHPGERFYVVLMSENRNEKYDYYFNQIKDKAERAYFFYLPYGLNKSFDFIPTMAELKVKSMLLPKVKRIYLASLEKVSIAAFLSTYPDAEIKTFDDGTGNLIQSSSYLGDEFSVNGTIKRNFARMMIGDWSIAKTRNASDEHYTIFKGLKNIMDDGRRKMTYLPLFDASELKAGDETGGTVRILLGSPDKEMKEISEKAAKNFNIQYVAPHPRQTYGLSGVTTLNSPYVIEDYILREIKKNPHTRYEIYTFFSGAALTMKDFPNVHVYALKPASLPEDYWLKPVYALFTQSGIPILTFDDKNQSYGKSK